MGYVAARDLVLQVEDLAGAAALYRDVLGMKEFLRVPGLVGLDAGAFRLFLESAAPLGPVLEFFTDDLHATRARLHELGCVLLVEDLAIPKCYFRDPYGMVFNLTQRAEAPVESEPEPIREDEPPPHY